jgi:hypothetical protein
MYIAALRKPSLQDMDDLENARHVDADLHKRKNKVSSKV